MKDEIKKILEMTKAGKITEDQATALIEELKGRESIDAAEAIGGDRNEDPRRQRGFRERNGFRRDHRWEHAGPRARGHHHGPRGFFASMIHEKIHRAFDGHCAPRSAHGAPTDLDDNSIHMSRVDRPGGSDFSFKGNLIAMASVTDLELRNSEMTGHRIEASKLDDVSLNGAKWMDSQITASSVHDLHVESGEMKNLRVQGTKLADVSMKGSSLNDCELNGSAVKGLDLQSGSRWHEFDINGSQVSEVSTKESSITASDFEFSQISDVSIERSDLKELSVRAFRVSDLVIADSKLKEVLIAGGEGWSLRKRGLADVRIEHCEFTKASFTDCSFQDVTFRNVKIENIKVQGLQLSRRVIDGNDAFFEAIGQKK